MMGVGPVGEQGLHISTKVGPRRVRDLLKTVVIVHSTSTNMVWHMLALHPFSSLDIQSLVISSFIILQ